MNVFKNMSGKKGLKNISGKIGTLICIMDLSLILCIHCGVENPLI